MYCFPNESSGVTEAGGIQPDDMPGHLPASPPYGPPGGPRTVDEFHVLVDDVFAFPFDTRGFLGWPIKAFAEGCVGHRRTSLARDPTLPCVSVPEGPGLFGFFV